LEEDTSKYYRTNNFKIILGLLLVLASLNFIQFKFEASNNFIDNILRIFYFGITLLYLRIDKANFRLYIHIISYLLIYVSFSLINNVYYMDIINSCLFIVYYLCFISLDFQKISKLKINVLLIKILFLFFLLSYLIQVFLFNIRRPIVFLENNFELMFLSLILVAVTKSKLLKSKLWLLIYSMIILVSGSKSGLLILLAILIYYFLYQKNKVKKTYYLFTLSLLILFLGFNYIDFNSIDRYTFVLKAIDSIKLMNIVDVFFPFKLSPLPEPVCDTLLNSYTGSWLEIPGLCYGKVLHSWLISSFLNHGLLILLFINSVRKHLFEKFSNYSGLLLLIILINGLSVSAFDSIYSWFGLLFIIPIWRKK